MLLVIFVQLAVILTTRLRIVHLKASSQHRVSTAPVTRRTAPTDVICTEHQLLRCESRGDEGEMKLAASDPLKVTASEVLLILSKLPQSLRASDQRHRVRSWKAGLAKTAFQEKQWHS